MIIAFRFGFGVGLASKTAKKEDKMKITFSISNGTKISL